MSIREDIKNQIIAGLKNATFPIATPEALLAALPAGANTTCKSGDFVVSAGEAGKLLTPSDFPFQSAEQVGETIVSRAGF